MIDKLSPIILFVYNRPDHTKKTIEALKNNLLADQSDLIIFADGHKLGENKIEQDRVNEVRDHLKTVNGFKTLTVIEREKNYGLVKSIIDGVTETVNKYGQVIVLEDDLIVSPYFLTYMNEALTLYQDDNQVASIHGYIYPIKKPLPETFFIKGADCWGWATWKRAWDKFEPDGAKLWSEIKQKKLKKEFNFGNTYPYDKMLQAQTKVKKDSWAVCWYASAFLANMLTLYPGRSLVQNIGLDRSGTHDASQKTFVVSLTDSPINLSRLPIIEDLETKRKISDYFKAQHLSGLSARFNFFIHWLKSKRDVR